MIRVVVLIISSLFISCLVYEQGLSINSDGSAELNIEYSLNSSVYKNLLELQNANNKKDSLKLSYFDEDLIKGHLDSFDSVESHRVRVHKDKKNINVNLNVRVVNLQKALTDGLIPYARLYKEKENWRFIYSTPHDMKAIKDEESTNRLKDLTIKLKINTPSNIIETNGDKISEDEVLWNFSPNTKSKVSDLPNTFFVEFDGEKIF